MQSKEALSLDENHQTLKHIACFLCYTTALSSGIGAQLWFVPKETDSQMLGQDHQKLTEKLTLRLCT
jgi:hypothetical protein